jgi:hypothetical protein
MMASKVRMPKGWPMKRVALFRDIVISGEIEVENDFECVILFS